MADLSALLGNDPQGAFFSTATAMLEYDGEY